MKQHDGLPLGIRISLEGATKAHQELSSQRAAVTAELRSAATIASDGQVWVEQVRIATEYQRRPELSLDGDGPLAELLQYLERLPGDDAALTLLADELKDLARKLPPEIVQSPDGLLLDQIDWIRDIVSELKPMLLERLGS